MRIAFLIAVHDNPEQLTRLVRALTHKDASFYIHVDKKAELRPFRRSLDGREDVEFVEDRVAVEWMGFSQVQATLKMMELACARGFDYCVLLSGSDYPIKPIGTIISFFGSSREEFLSFWRLQDRPSWEHKVQYYYPIDAIPIRAWSQANQGVYWRRLFWGRYFRYRRFLPKRRFLDDMVAYGGSQWWSLTQGCVNFVLKFVEENPKFVRFYRYTASPDEMFFQTIVMNSEWATRVHNSPAYWEWSRAREVNSVRQDTSMLPEECFNLRYIDWGGENTGLRERPAILDQRDWDRLRLSQSHFARKFASGRSAKLLDMIDLHLLNRSSRHLGQCNDDA